MLGKTFSWENSKGKLKVVKYFLEFIPKDTYV